MVFGHLILTILIDLYVLIYFMVAHTYLFIYLFFIIVLLLLLLLNTLNYLCYILVFDVIPELLLLL